MTYIHMTLTLTFNRSFSYENNIPEFSMGSYGSNSIVTYENLDTSESRKAWKNVFASEFKVDTLSHTITSIL